MTAYELGRVRTWERTGLLDKCVTDAERLAEALKWEALAKQTIAATHRYL
jgi:hypothetical protein